MRASYFDAATGAPVANSNRTWLEGYDCSFRFSKTGRSGEAYEDEKKRIIWECPAQNEHYYEFDLQALRGLGVLDPEDKFYPPPSGYLWSTGDRLRNG